MVRHSSLRYRALISITTLFALFPIASTLRPSAARLAVIKPVEAVEETVTLTPGDTKTWVHYEESYSKLPYCGPPFKVGPAIDDTGGKVVAGYKHYYDKGAAVFPCPELLSWTYRGTVWFDLAGIIAKAPPLHVYVKSATLKFKALDPECPVHLLIANKDWSKGLSKDELATGDPLTDIESCGRDGCSADVQTVVNNWVRGADHGGYVNNGFVIKGDREGSAKDNDSCMTRYGDFSLTVTYKYDKSEAAPPVILVAKPEPAIIVAPGVLNTGTDVALKKIATQSSTYGAANASLAVDGNTDGSWAIGSVACTNSENHAWWEVDLGSAQSIQKIKVWNRTDCCADRTSDFYVFVSDKPFTSTDLDVTKAEVGAPGTFFVAGPSGRPTQIPIKRTGRYVRVQLKGANYLQLAEVEVLAGP